MRNAGVTRLNRLIFMGVFAAVHALLTRVSPFDQPFAQPAGEGIHCFDHQRDEDHVIADLLPVFLGDDGLGQQQPDAATDNPADDGCFPAFRKTFCRTIRYR